MGKKQRDTKVMNNGARRGTTRMAWSLARRGNRHMRVRGSMRAAPARPRAGIARLGRGDDHRASQRAGILR